MGDVPGWLREQLQIEGWVVVESLETFDVHLGQRYANRAMALHKALTGDALLSSRGKASTSRDIEGEFIIGRLRRSAQPLPSEGDVVLLYALDSIERHTRPSTRGTPTEPARGERATRSWTCPSCKRTWQLLAEEGELPEEAARCPVCGAPPSEFAPGQIVRVRHLYGSATRLGIVEGPVQTDYFLPDVGKVVVNEGPYTGELMIWHLREGYGSDAPVSPELELAVFSNLPREPERRRALAAHLMMGIAAGPDQVRALEPEEQRRLS